MSEPITYKLVTIADIVDCLTDDNIDNFLIDFKSFVKTTQNMAYMVALIDPELKGKKVSESLGISVFNWIDDGKHDTTGGLRVTHPETGETTDIPMDMNALDFLANALKDRKL